MRNHDRAAVRGDESRVPAQPQNLSQVGAYPILAMLPHALGAIKAAVTLHNVLRDASREIFLRQRKT
jgi:hypothetical protein